MQLDETKHENRINFNGHYLLSMVMNVIIEHDNGNHKSYQFFIIVVVVIPF